MKKILTAALLLFSITAFANKNVVNVYNWSNYLPNKIIREFEKQTGIHVNYSEFNSNNTLYTKLKADPKIGYDIVVPSSYYVDLMRQQGMLRKLDHSQLSNMKYLNPLLLNRSFDPHNEYSIPYFWGSTGIVVNDRYHNPKNFQTWNTLWNKKYRNQLLILNDPRESFAMALLSLGYSVNDRNPKHLKQAYEKLRKLMPNIKLFNSDAEDNIYIDADTTLGIGWSGDIYLSWQENKHLHFIYPKPHFPIWIDCAVIPKYAPHYQNALKFLNFIMQPKIAAEMSKSIGYSTPNLAGMKLLPKKIRNNPILNPSQQTLKRGIVESDLGKSDAIYEQYWQLLKLTSSG